MAVGFIRGGAIAVVLGACALAHAQEDDRASWRDRVSFGGTAEAEWGVETTTGDTQKFEVQIQPEWNFNLTDNLDLTIIGRIRLDAIDDLEPGRPNQGEIAWLSRRVLVGDPLELELREFYLETTVGETYLTLGKQQIVWGQADGLKVLDVVNPQDFREFVLDDFEDSRIPLWSVNAEIPIKELTLQLLWIPDLTYHNIPEFNSTYAFVSNVPTAPPFIPFKFEEVDRPNNPLKDSDIGARLSAFVGGWDLTLNYLYHYDDTPVVRRGFGLTEMGFGIVAQPGYERTHLIGGTFSNAFGDLTLRGELGYSFNKFYSTENLLDADGVLETDEFAYVLGFDWFGFSETFLSLQVFQNFLTEDDDGLLRDRVETNVSLNVQRDFLNDSLIAETLWVHNINHGDGFIRPKLSYEWTSDTKVWAGLDIFYGSGEGLFGQYDQRDRALLGIEWSF